MFWAERIRLSRRRGGKPAWDSAASCQEAQQGPGQGGIFPIGTAVARLIKFHADQINNIFHIKFDKPIKTVHNSQFAFGGMSEWLKEADCKSVDPASTLVRIQLPPPALFQVCPVRK